MKIVGKLTEYTNNYFQKKKKNYEIRNYKNWKKERKKKKNQRGIKINRPVIEYVCRPI